MRSVSVGLELPKIKLPRRKLRPQSAGLWRRTLVKTKLKFARAAGVGAGAAGSRGKAWFLLFKLASVTKKYGLAALGGLLLSLGWLARLILSVITPIVKFAKMAWAAVLAVTTHIKDLLIIHSMRRQGRIAPTFMLLAFTLVLFFSGFAGLGLEVQLDGQSLGFVESRGVITALVKEVENRIAEYTGVHTVLNPAVTYNLRFIESDNMLDTQSLKNTLFSSVSGKSEGAYVLRVDGQIVGGAGSRTAIENMLERIKTMQSFSDEPMKTDFVQDVSIEPAGAFAADLAGIVEMEDLLTSNSMEVKKYSIQQGDTISAVAKRYEMSVAEIKMLNPNLDINKVSIGEEIEISAAVPFISLRQMRTERYEESVPFDTVIEYSDSMYSNQSKITRAGVPGLADVVADVVYIDGAVHDRDVLEYTVTLEPVSQIKVVGTKTPPAKAATGKFRKPSNGVFTSGFGYRKSFGDYHTGVDFAGKIGTAIWASDGGTVTWAGTKSTGGYGKYIIIDHGNGYTTLYAHCSSLLVKVGQKVAPGEQIAKVGNTGRSTGPHVHFEIRYNGKAQNPLKYISK